MRPVPATVEVDGALEPLAALLLVPLPFHALAVLGQPPPRPEGLAHVDAKAVVRSTLDDIVAEGADLHHRGDTAAQELGHGEIHAGPSRLLVLRLAPHGQHLEEPRVPELRVAAVLDEGAVERRAADVRVRGDEPGREDAVGGVHRLVHAPVEAGPHVEDAVALDDHHAVAQEAMAPPVEGDHVASPNRDPLCWCHGSPFD